MLLFLLLFLSGFLWLPVVFIQPSILDTCRLAVWLSGNALAWINVVALRQIRLVHGWVTVCGQVNHLGM